MRKSTMDKSVFYTAAGNFRIRWWLPIVAVVGTIIFAGFHFFVMQPYEVHDKGMCAFIISPTDWNEGDVLPCGTVRTYDAIPASVYNAR